MENATIKEENVIVKKGIVYYTGRIIFIVVHGIALAFKTAIQTIIGYISDINVAVSKHNKTKKLLRRKDIDTELV